MMDEKIKEIEFDILPLNYLNPFKAKAHIQHLLSRIKELEEGIEKHRQDMWGKDVMYQVNNCIDEELYKLMEKEKGG